MFGSSRKLGGGIGRNNSCFFSSFSAIAASDPALTSLARYLIHDSSEYVTGNNFIVDCGATLPGVPIYSL